MYLLQLVQALKYENFIDIQGGLEPASKREGVLAESSTIGDLERSAETSKLESPIPIFRHYFSSFNIFACTISRDARNICTVGILNN